jgi:hypothetical protein
MSWAQTAASPIYCDGCGQEASAEHLRQRFARLEWASRFRPIRIETMILVPEPAQEVEDYFYFPQGWPKDPEARALQEDLLASCAVFQKGAENREAALDRFQKAGYFLANCVECPTGTLGGEEFDAFARRLTPILARRIRFSYRPKAVLLISERLAEVAKALSGAGLEARLLMGPGGPVAIPKSNDIQGREQFRAEISSLLG